MPRWACAFALAILSPATHADTFVCSQDSIRVFADDAGTGLPAPLRIIQGSATQNTECYGLAIDRTRGELWAATSGQAFVYPLGADGNVAPLRGIAVGAAGLGFAVSIAVDAMADEVLVGTADGRIHAFPRDASEATPPLRSIDASGAGVVTITGLAVDRSRDEILVASLGQTSMLVAFARTADGVGTPVRPPLPLGNPGAIAVDAGRDEWYVVSGTSVLVTRAGQTLATFSSGHLENPYGLAIRGDRQVLASDRRLADDPVLRFPAHPNGNAGPLATIFNGSASGRTAFGVVTSFQAACVDGNTASCLFRDGFE